MLPAMLNRATMRVADTTEVSGRVTADSREKQTMKPTIRRCLALAIAFLGLYLALPDRGLAQNDQGQNDQGIKLGVPNGTYSWRDSGQVTVTLPGSSTPTTLLISAAGRTTYFANGTTSGALWASVNGQISAITIHGTWVIDPKDGSIFETEVQTGGPGATLHFRDFPTLDGNTIQFVEVDPGSILNGIETR